MDESRITYDAAGNARCFSGPDAVKLFQAAALASGLGLMAVGIKPHRSWTSLSAALAMASSYTGKPYKGKKDIARARADLKIWCDTMKAAIPTVHLAENIGSNFATPKTTLRDILE